jgi:mercuric ion transport protein
VTRSDGDTRLVGTLALVASTGTLICCALPILLVTLGLGSAVAAMTSAAPWLIFLSMNKTWVFAGSAVMIGAAAYWQARPFACPADPDRADACRRLHRLGQRLNGIAAALWAIGFTAAYLAEPVARWLDS